MAKWILEMTDELEPRVVDAFCRRFRFGEQDAQLRMDFARRRVIEFIRSAVIEEEGNTAAFMARLVAMEKAGNEIGDGLMIESEAEEEGA